jgi:hypothetical protein
MRADPARPAGRPTGFWGGLPYSDRRPLTDTPLARRGEVVRVLKTSRDEIFVTKVFEMAPGPAWGPVERIPTPGHCPRRRRRGLTRPDSHVSVKSRIGAPHRTLGGGVGLTFDAFAHKAAMPWRIIHPASTRSSLARRHREWGPADRSRRRACCGVGPRHRVGDDPMRPRAARCGGPQTVGELGPSRSS